MWILIAVFIFADKQAILLPTTKHTTEEACLVEVKKMKKDLALRQGEGLLAPSRGKVAASCIREK